MMESEKLREHLTEVDADAHSDLSSGLCAAEDAVPEDRAAGLGDEQLDLTATVIGGSLELDAPLALPDKSRVRVTVESLSETNDGWQTALRALDRLRRERPIRAQGLRFTRDELHERH